MRLSFAFLPALCTVLIVQAANPGLQHGPFFQGTDLHFDIAETSKAQNAAALAEHLFGLPENHLSPVYGYAPNQHQALVNHMSSANSRFVVLRRFRRQWTFVVSPWYVLQPGVNGWERSMLLLQVWPGGVVIPAGYVLVKGGVPPGHRVELGQTLSRAAKTTQEDLVRKFEIRSIVTPVAY